MTRFNWDYIFLKNQFQEKMTCQKLARILQNKCFQKLNLSENVKNKKHFPLIVFLKGKAYQKDSDNF